MEGLPERYADVYRPTFAVPGLRTAVSNSVARSGAAPAGAEVENMEGAAFFAVAAALGVPAAEVRAVSNRVGEPFGVWRVADACEALARELALLGRRNRIRLFAGSTSPSPIRRGCRKGEINLKFKPIGL